MKKYVAIGILITLISSCKSEKKKELTAKERFDKIERITDGNWQINNPDDTSYVYYSRVSDTRVNVYNYNIDKGDSVDNNLSTIELVNDSICWTRPGATKGLLISVNDSIMQWRDVGEKKILYSVERKDSAHIIYTAPGEPVRILIKTPSLTTFLVRKKYDYTHGTDLATKDTSFHAHPK